MPAPNVWSVMESKRSVLPLHSSQASNAGKVTINVLPKATRVAIDSMRWFPSLAAAVVEVLAATAKTVDTICQSFDGMSITVSLTLSGGRPTMAITIRAVGLARTDLKIIKSIVRAHFATVSATCQSASAWAHFHAFTLKKDAPMNNQSAPSGLDAQAIHISLTGLLCHSPVWCKQLEAPSASVQHTLIEEIRHAVLMPIGQLLVRTMKEGGRIDVSMTDFRSNTFLSFNTKSSDANANRLLLAGACFPSLKDSLALKGAIALGSTSVSVVEALVPIDSIADVDATDSLLTSALQVPVMVLEHVNAPPACWDNPKATDILQDTVRAYRRGIDMRLRAIQRKKRRKVDTSDRAGLARILGNQGNTEGDDKANDSDGSRREVEATGKSLSVPILFTVTASGRITRQLVEAVFEALKWKLPHTFYTGTKDTCNGVTHDKSSVGGSSSPIFTSIFTTTPSISGAPATPVQLTSCTTPQTAEPALKMLRSDSYNSGWRWSGRSAPKPLHSEPAAIAQPIPGANATAQCRVLTFQSYLNRESQAEATKYLPVCPSSAFMIQSAAEQTDRNDNNYSDFTYNVCQPSLGTISGDGSQAIHKSYFASAFVIGQWDRKFILVSIGSQSPGYSDEGRDNSSHILRSPAAINPLIAIDQHALHERIRLEAFLSTMEQFITSVPVAEGKDEGHSSSVVTYSSGAQIGLALPPHLWLSVEGAIQGLRHWGWRVSDAPPYALLQVPCVNIEGFTYTIGGLANFWEAVDELRGFGGHVGGRDERLCYPIPRCIRGAAVLRSCRGAIMFGDALTLPMCRQLVSAIPSLDQFNVCSHGRVSMVPLTDTGG